VIIVSNNAFDEIGVRGRNGRKQGWVELARSLPACRLQFTLAGATAEYGNTVHIRAFQDLFQCTRDISSKIECSRR